MIILVLINVVLLLFSLVIVKTTFSRLYIAGLFSVSLLIIRGAITEDSQLNELALFYLLMSNLFLVIMALIVSSLTNLSQPILNKEHKYDLTKLYVLSFGSLYLLIEASGGIQNVFLSWIVVKDSVEDQSFLRVLSTFGFLISMVYLRRLYSNKIVYKLIVLPVLSLFLFVLVLRVKLFIVPLIFIFLLPRRGKVFKMKSLLKTVAYFTLFYLVMMSIRWLGNLSSVSVQSAEETYSSVMSAGVEREMYHQFISVFSYYLNHPVQYGEAYIRFLLEPINRLFNFGYEIVNPIYYYYTIANNSVNVYGGSAHPSLYGDSFASFGFLGVFLPAIWLLLISKIEDFLYDENGEILFVAISISLPILVRGSVYYALFYFFALFLFWSFSRLKIKRYW